MKKILLGLILSFSFIAAQQIGEYSLDCESEQSSNYTVYINGFSYPGNGFLSITGKVKQGQNIITIVAKQNITNIFIKLDNDTTDKTVTNWNIALTNGVARTLVVNNLNNYGFNNPWESADSLSSLSSNDIVSISNSLNKMIDIFENEKFGDEFEEYVTNEFKYAHVLEMAWQESTSEEAISGARFMFLDGYGGENRRSFTKNIDYEITISPYNNKLVNVKSRTKKHIIFIGSNDSDEGMNWDYKRDYYSFFKKDGKWWMYY